MDILQKIRFLKNKYLPQDTEWNPQVTKKCSLLLHLMLCQTVLCCLLAVSAAHGLLPRWLAFSLAAILILSSVWVVSSLAQQIYRIGLHTNLVNEIFLLNCMFKAILLQSNLLQRAHLSKEEYAAWLQMRLQTGAAIQSFDKLFATVQKTSPKEE